MTSAIEIGPKSTPYEHVHQDEKPVVAIVPNVDESSANGDFKSNQSPESPAEATVAIPRATYRKRPPAALKKQGTLSKIHDANSMLRLQRTPTMGLIQTSPSAAILEHETNADKYVRITFSTATLAMYVLSSIGLIITGVSTCTGNQFLKTWMYVQCGLWLIGAVVSILLRSFKKDAPIKQCFYSFFLCCAAPITFLIFLLGNSLVFGRFAIENREACEASFFLFSYVFAILSWVYVGLAMSASCAVVWRNSSQSGEFSRIESGREKM